MFPRHPAKFRYVPTRFMPDCGRVLDGPLYELYFPEDVHGAGLRPFDLVEQTRLPENEKMPEPDRPLRLGAKFEELYDGAHPLRIALDKLQTRGIIRIIEGKA